VVLAYAMQVLVQGSAVFYLGTVNFFHMYVFSSLR